MTGLNITVCFWQVDAVLVEEILLILKKGKVQVSYNQCVKRSDLVSMLEEDPPDLIIADYEIPEKLRQEVEEELEPYYSEIPLIFLSGEEALPVVDAQMHSGVWDFVCKDKLIKLIPSVFSSRRYITAGRERKEAEKALRESRNRYRSIFNAVNEGIMVFDLETLHLIEYNPRVLELFELEESDMEGLDINELSVKEEGYDVELAKSYIKRAAEGESFYFEWKNRARSGRIFWTLNTFSIVEIGDSKGILLVKRDIDEQKRMEQSLMESQEHFRTLAENSPDIIMRFDRQHRHIYVNEAVIQTGIAAESFIGKSHSEMGIFPEDMIRNWEEKLETVFSTGKPTQVHFEIEFNGKRVSFEWRLYPEIGASEGVKSVIGVARDVSENRRSEKALRQSEDRLNMALQATNLGMWDWNLQNNDVYYSPIWMSMLGYGPDELPQELDTWTGLLHPDDARNSHTKVMEVIKNREASFEIEFRLKHKNGHYVWVRAMGKAVAFDEDGNTIRLTGIHEDISKRKRDEQVKQVAFDISTAVSTTHSLDELYLKIRESLGSVLDTTNCFLALYNAGSDTLTLPFMEDEKDSFTEFPARKTLTSYVIRTGVAQLVDKEREVELTKEGEIEPVGAPCESWLGVPLKHEDRTIGVFAVQSYSVDVVYTEADADLLEFASDQIALAIERRRHQDNIKASQDHQRRVFESSPDPMLVVDTEALITDFNSAFLEAFSVEPDMVFGQKIFRFIHRDHWRQSINDFQRIWEEGYLKNLEYKIVRPDGYVFDGEASCGAMFTMDGKPESMVVILKNISERKDAERKMMEARFKAEESDRLKTAFLSNMSHEIRTPMNAIVGFSDLLSDEDLTPDDRRDFIAQINQGADDLMRLIDDIIDIAKIEAGQVNVHIAECFIRDLFKELHLMFIQNLKRAGKEEVEVVLKWDWPMAELAIYTDPFRLKQILVNLLGNAVKFTEKGTITLGIDEHPSGIRFYVKDTGIGIREEKQKVIFDRFMQGHETKTKLYGGTGLGLAISKNLTEILGGDIGLESVSGEGSTFWFILPRNEVPLKYEAALRAPTQDIKSWEGRRILVAEDDHSNYYFLYEALKDTGAEIMWAKDGEETLAVFREHSDLDLVLMDINMPLVNGYECTRIIKEERPDIPVVAQTAYAMSGEREISREAGCDDYLSKPIKVKELLETIAKHI